MTPKQKQHELAAIRERNHCLAIRLNDVPDTLILPSTAGQFVADIDTLLNFLADAELRRSETVAMCDLLRQDVQAAEIEAEQAADARQAEIVAWLRKRAAKLADAMIQPPLTSKAISFAVQAAADAIERGEFREKWGEDG